MKRKHVIPDMYDEEALIQRVCRLRTNLCRTLYGDILCA